MKNPLEILGITRELVTGMRNEQIQELVLKNRTVLTAIFHPDRGGNAQRMKDVIEAYELIDPKKGDESQFDFWLKKLRKPVQSKMRDEIEVARRQAVSLQETLSQFKDHFEEYLLHNVLEQHVQIVESLSGLKRRLSVFHVPTGTLLFVQKTIQKAVLGQRWKDMYAPTMTLGIESDGSITCYKEEVIDEADAEEGQRTGEDIQHFARQWLRRSVNPEQMFTGVHLVGALPHSLLKRSEQGTTPAERMLDYHGGNSQRAAEEGIEPALFNDYLPNLRATFKHSDCLVGLKQTDRGPRFVLIGTVLKITLPQDADLQVKKKSRNAALPGPKEVDTGGEPLTLDENECLACAVGMDIQMAQTPRAFAKRHGRDPEVFDHAVEWLESLGELSPATKRAVSVPNDRTALKVYMEKDLEKVLESVPDTFGKTKRTFKELRPAMTIDGFLEECAGRDTPLFRSMLYNILLEMKIMRAADPLKLKTAGLHDALYWQHDLEKVYEEFVRRSQEQGSDRNV